MEIQGKADTLHKAACKISKVNPQYIIFTKEKLDQQFKFFNLTRYAKQNLVKSTGSGEKKGQGKRSNQIFINSKPQPAYIPPYRRTNSAKYTTIPRTASGPNKAKCDEKVIIISNKFSEQRWMDCKKFGFFGYWNGPISERPKLIDWLRKHCLNQVSISHFTDRITYLHSSNEETKKKFLQLSECLFQGYVIKFFEWIPDCKEENLDFIIPTWVTLQSVPSELMHSEILKRIGASLGETVGIEAPFETLQQC